MSVHTLPDLTHELRSWKARRKLNFAPSRNIEYLWSTVYVHIYTYRVSQEECAILRESVSYVKLYRYNPKHLYPKLNGYGDNGQRSLKL